jgi:hypothetical protein
MNKSEAMQCALGYAWGQEDATNHATHGNDFLFATAFAAGWEAYNTEQRSHMVPVAEAYKRWNATRGVTIFPADDTQPATQTVYRS